MKVKFLGLDPCFDGIPWKPIGFFINFVLAPHISS